MESPNYLYPGAERILTETDVEIITSIQNNFTANQAHPLDLVSFDLDKPSYLILDQLVISLEVFNRENIDITGGISCLIRPTGKPDRE
jgi:hypothetical protein